MPACALKMPAHPQAASFEPRACGALSVPRKRRGLPDGYRGGERGTVFLGLENRQAVVMRAQAALEEGVAVHEQVLRCHGRGDAFACAQHELRGPCG